MKQYDAYTRTDAHDRMVGHFCTTGDCGHCKAGVPFANPPIEFLGQLTDAALSALRERNGTTLLQAQMAVRAIEAEQEARR